MQLSDESKNTKLGFFKVRVQHFPQEFNSGFIFLDKTKHLVDEIAIRDETSAFSYGQLGQASILAALHMRRLGIGRGDTVGVKTTDLLAMMAIVFGTALLGCRWIYASKNIIDAEVLKLDLVLEDFKDVPEFEGSVFLDERWGCPPVGDSLTDLPEFSGYQSPDDIWMISSTSGTTGTSKLVGLSHKVTTHRNHAARVWFDTPATKISSLFPSGAPAMMSRYLAALLHGGQIVSSVDPQQWLEHEVDYVFGSPAQARIVFSDTVLDRKLPEMHLMGSTASDKLVEHLLKSFQVVAIGYGSTEAYNCVAMNKTLANDGSVQVNTVLRDTKIELVDQDDIPVGQGKEGIMRLSGSCVVNGYLNNQQATKAFFKNGYFYPGDIATWMPDGSLLITGRVNDLFNLGGLKLNAGLMDYTLQNIDGVEDAICFLVPDDMGEKSLRAFLTLAKGHSATTVLHDAKIALLILGGSDAVPKKFLFADQLPRNPNGKPNRDACVAMVQAQKDTSK